MLGNVKVWIERVLRWASAAPHNPPAESAPARAPCTPALTLSNSLVLAMRLDHFLHAVSTVQTASVNAGAAEETKHADTCSQPSDVI